MTCRLNGIGRIVDEEENGVELQGWAIPPLDVREYPRLVNGELGLEVAHAVWACVVRQGVEDPLAPRLCGVWGGDWLRFLRY